MQHYHVPPTATWQFLGTSWGRRKGEPLSHVPLGTHGDNADPQRRRIPCVFLPHESLGRRESAVLLLHEPSNEPFIVLLWGLFDIVRNRAKPLSESCHRNLLHGRKVMYHEPCVTVFEIIHRTQVYHVDILRVFSDLWIVLFRIWRGFIENEFDLFYLFFFSITRELVSPLPFNSNHRGFVFRKEFKKLFICLILWSYANSVIEVTVYDYLKLHIIC